MSATKGALSMFAGRWMKMPCEFPGCRKGADTLGEIRKGKVGNVCDKHAKPRGKR